MASRSAWKMSCEYLPILTEQEAKLILTNLRDAIGGQSKSPNIVPFHMLGIGFLLCNSNVDFKMRRFYDIRLQKMS